MTGARVEAMSTQELLALPVTVDIETAARVFGMGRTQAYQLARIDAFPVPVIRLGTSSKAPIRVAKADLLRAVGLPPDSVSLDT